MRKTPPVHTLALALWTYEGIRDQCREPYRRYTQDLDAHYRAYFASHRDYAGVHSRQARDIEAALPPGWGHLADDLPEKARHRHHLSGRSSQVLAVSLLV